MQVVRAWSPARSGHNPGTKSRKIAVSRNISNREFFGNEDSREERLQKALVLIRMAEQLNPAEAGYNIGVQAWNLLRGASVKDRLQILEKVNSADIRNMWKIAGNRYQASKEQILQSVGPNWNLNDEFPAEEGQIFVHEGKAAIPGILGLNRYQKHFFMDNQSRILGRVVMQFYVRPLSNLIYPLYYETLLGSCQVPATGQACDVRFNFFKPKEELKITQDDIPAGWPKPLRPLYPFEGDLTDYVRVFAPGIYVTWGWKKARPEKRDIGRQSFQAIQVLTTEL